MKTKAAVQIAPGDQLTVDELELPDPKADQVLVKLYSSGVCHSQLHQGETPISLVPWFSATKGQGLLLKSAKA